MANLWDDIAKTIKEGVDTVVEKTEQYSKIGKIKVDIINIKRNIERNFAELGGKVYHIIVEEKKTQVAGDKGVKELLESVQKLEKELQEKDRELEKVKAGTQTSAKSSPKATKKEPAAKTEPAAKKGTTAKKTTTKKQTTKKPSSSAKRTTRSGTGKSKPTSK